MTLSNSQDLEQLRREEGRRRHRLLALRSTDPSPSEVGVPVAYPGPAGSHTAAAAAALFPSARLVPVYGFRAVADAVAAGEAAHGVLPIESSLAGAVAETHDLLYERELSIVGETVLPIRHCLAAAFPIGLDMLRVIRSHPSALEQCRDLLARLPHATAVAASTTAEAAKQVADDGDETAAAIVSPEAVSLFGLTVLADDVGDSPSFTRFVSIASYTRVELPLRAARTAFTFATDHRPGALHAAIEPFARAGLDLVRLVSRPLPATPWKYRFDAVVAGHPLEPALRIALRELDSVTRTLRVVGVYEGHEEQA
jgi:prephenate dehydratase